LILHISFKGRVVTRVVYKWEPPT